MIVERLITDRWSGIQCEEDIVENPSITNFVAALHALNACNRTMLCLEGKNGRQLTIAGGDGKYIVYCAFSDSEFWNLISDSSRTERVMLNTGGQEGDYPARQIVDQDHAQRAGIRFMEKGELDSNLHWEQQR